MRCSKQDYLVLCDASNVFGIAPGRSLVKTCTIETKDEGCLSLNFKDMSFEIGTCVVRTGGSRAAPRVSFSIIFEGKNNS
jgi:hypothetical protein